MKFVDRVGRRLCWNDVVNRARRSRTSPREEVPGECEPALEETGSSPLRWSRCASCVRGGGKVRSSTGSRRLFTSKQTETSSLRRHCARTRLFKTPIAGQ